MTCIALARVPTDSAARYAIQTDRHWAHNLAVAGAGDTSVITFPRDARGADWPGDAKVTLVPEDRFLLCKIEASAEGQRDGLKGAVQRHVERFAVCEAPLPFVWIDNSGGTDPQQAQ